MKKQPEKTELTKKKIMDTFWELARIRGLLHVTVSEVMKLAGFNRGTFYVYFSDLNDLIRQTEEEIQNYIQEELFTKIDRNSFENPEDFYSRLIKVITRYEDKLFVLIGSNGDPTFTKKIREDATVFINNLLGPYMLSDEQHYIAAYSISALIGTLTYWYEQGKRVELREIMKISQKLYIHGVDSLINNP